MIPVFQILLVLLAIATIVRAPRRLPHWLAAAAALQFAFTLLFEDEGVLVFAAVGLGGNFLILLIHAECVLQDCSELYLLRLIAPVLPAFVLVPLFYTCIATIFAAYDLSDGQFTPAESLLPIVLLIALLVQIITTLRFAVGHKLQSIDLAVGIGIVLLAIGAALYGDPEGPVRTGASFYILLISIGMFNEAKDKVLLRLAIAANAAGHGLMGVSLLMRTSGSGATTQILVNMSAVFGLAVALTCVSLIRHPAAALFSTRTDQSGGTAHPPGLAG